MINLLVLSELTLYVLYDALLKDSCSLKLSLYSRMRACNLVLQDGDSSKRMSRPFGVALLVAGYDELDGLQLFFSDPSGTFVRYKSKAIGAGSEGAQSNLSESYNDNLTMEEAEELALSTLKQSWRKRSVRRMLNWRELFKIRDSILLLRRKLVSFLIDCKMRGRVTISLRGVR